MELRRFAYKVDLLYRTIHLSDRTVEVPIHFLERKDDRSKLSMMELVSTYKVVMILRARRMLVGPFRSGIKRSSPKTNT